MIHIEGRRWFRKGPGNTYHSVRIYMNGHQIAFLPKTYGYEDQYLETALEWLEKQRGNLDGTSAAPCFNP